MDEFFCYSTKDNLINAMAKSSRIIFNAVISNQTNGNGFGVLSAIANNAIFQYRDMYLRPKFYDEIESKVKIIIVDVISQNIVNK